MPKFKTLNFWSEIVKRLFGATHVFGRSFTFCNFVFIGGALNLLRHVVELSVWLTMSWPIEITYKLSMSRLDFLVLVLQTSNGFHLDSLSFQVFFHYNPYCLRGPWSSDTCGVLCFPLGFFLKGQEYCFCSFFRLKSSNCFSVKNHVFGRSFIFVLFVCIERELKLSLKMEALPTTVTV